MRTLFTQIKGLNLSHPKDLKPLRGKDLLDLPLLENAWLLAEDGKIHSYGAGDSWKEIRADNMVNCQGRYLLPAFTDSHTHIVFARTREEEFVDRIRGLSYQEIAARGGGILNSSLRLQQCTEQELFDQALERARIQISQGTGALEIKSGYGLTVADELKMLRVITRLKEALPIPIKATFLGAHAFPREYATNHEGYLKLIIEQMLPQIAQEGLADYIDVFCDQGYYSVDETERLLDAGARYGLKPKIHGNELGRSGGVQVAVKKNAISVDHLEEVGEEEIALLAGSDTIATILPGTSFFLGIPYAPARKLVDAGAALCIASDFNPGSSPNGRMSFLVSLACIHSKLLPEEALNASTINASCALELQGKSGYISHGLQANLLLTKPMESLSALPYFFGQDMLEQVYVNGRLWK